MKPEQALAALRVLHGALGAQRPGKRKDSGAESDLRQRLQDAVDGKLDDAGLREVAIEMIVADQIGKDRRGQRTGWAPGSISRAIDAELLAGHDKETNSALRTLKAWLRAAQTWVRGVVGVVRAMDKARADGKDLAGWDQFVDDLLGLNESKYARAVEGEAEGMLGESHSVSVIKSAIQAAREGKLVTMPELSEAVKSSIGSHGRDLVLKPNIVAKNDNHHPELDDDSSAEVLTKALYSPNRAIQTKPSKQPGYWLLVSEDTPQSNAVVVEVSSSKDVDEIVGWYQLRRQSVEQKEKKAGQEGGQVLTIAKGDSAGLSDGLPDQGTGNTNPSNSQQTNSLTPVQRLGLVENRLAVVLSQNTEAGRKFAQRANERLARLRSRYADVPAARSKAELDQQQRGMVEARRAELEEMLVGEVEYEMQGVHDLDQKLYDHPLFDTFFTKRGRQIYGRIKPPGKWRAEQVTLQKERQNYAIPGDYDGAAGLPPWVFRRAKHACLEHPPLPGLSVKPEKLSGTDVETLTGNADLLAVFQFKWFGHRKHGVKTSRLVHWAVTVERG